MTTPNTTTPNTLNRRSVMLSAAALTGLPLLGQVSAHAEGPGIDLGEWTLIDSLSDSFDAPLDAARWRRGLWYSVSGAGAFREENAETSDGVLHLTAKAESFRNKSHTFGAVESVFDTPGVCSYVEVRAKALPSAANVLSAVWFQSSTLTGEGTLATDPNPEIDLQETFDFHAVIPGLRLWPSDAPDRPLGQHTHKTADDVSADYHLYGVERREGELLIYWDRQLIWHLQPAPDPCLWRMSRHVVLSLEGHLGAPQDSALPASFDIDYVRTYYRTPAQAQPDGDVRLLDPEGRALTLTPGGVALSASTSEDTRWHLRRQDDLTYVITSPQGAALGAASTNAYPGGGLEALADVSTGTDTAGSRFRWHLLPVDGGARIRSKLSGLALSATTGQPITGEEDQATTWRIEPLAPC
ncbi:beta-glucanase [Arachnia rubra]|mgnify:FL=1|jgi:licheninase|uniref:Beta-glucanase n=1 Tax=Arachnia rubra TaxID=1547448 RepID=A0ABX7Y5M8_9ACTN|nr:beta-glucanase [Arachnia rubra]QUC07808.1 beta-glucanase [Arachnia rubra]BCR82133.1 hypothetical protein SK1NUM_25760 [Arachnia rubra]